VESCWLRLHRRRPPLEGGRELTQGTGGRCPGPGPGPGPGLGLVDPDPQTESRSSTQHNGFIYIYNLLNNRTGFHTK